MFCTRKETMLTRFIWSNWAKSSCMLTSLTSCCKITRVCSWNRKMLTIMTTTQRVIQIWHSHLSCTLKAVILETVIVSIHQSRVFIERRLQLPMKNANFLSRNETLSWVYGAPLERKLEAWNNLHRNAEDSIKSWLKYSVKRRELSKKRDHQKHLGVGNFSRST